MSKYGCSTGKHNGHDSARAASACFKEADDARNPYVYHIAELKRLTNSVNGNPRYLITFVGGTKARTKPDAVFCYSITNPEFQGVPVEVDFTRSGLIEDIRVAHT